MQAFLWFWLLSNAEVALETLGTSKKGKRVYWLMPRQSTQSITKPYR